MFKSYSNLININERRSKINIQTESNQADLKKTLGRACFYKFRLKLYIYTKPSYVWSLQIMSGYKQLLKTINLHVGEDIRSIQNKNGKLFVYQ